MATLNVSPITAPSDRSLERTGTARTTVQVELSDDARHLLLLDLVRALARQAAAEAWGQANPETSKETTP